MRLPSRLLAPALALLVAASTAYAADPAPAPLVAYQGRLIEAGVVANGNRTFVFAILDSANTELWNSGNRILPVTNGLYSVVLGGAGMPAIPTTLLLSAGLKLRVSIDGQVLTPDVAMVPAMQARRAWEAETVTGTIPWSQLSGVPGNVSGAAGGTGAANRVAVWNSATTIAADANLTWDGTRLGTLDGAVATPAYAFNSATNTGLYYIPTGGSEAVATAVGGVNRLSVGVNGVSANPRALADSEFFGQNSGNATYTGLGNTALGSNVLRSLTSGSHNVGVGSNALYSDLAGSYNVGLGSEALYSATGFGNVAVGYKAARNAVAAPLQTAGGFTTNRTYVIVSTGSTDFTAIGAADSNPGTVFIASGPGSGSGTAALTSSATVALGFRAATSLTTGFAVAIGPNAFAAATTAQGIAIGRDALRACTADANIAIGASALRFLTTGVSNQGIGGGALGSLTVGRWNTVIGEAGAFGSMSGTEANSSYNIGIGWGVGSSATTANGNLILGVQAGNVPTTITGNIFLGPGAGNTLGATVSNTLAIGGNVAGIADGRINTIVIDYNTAAAPNGPVMTNKIAFSDTVTLGAATNHAITSVSANTTLDATHRTVLVDATAGPVTITLPAASGVNGRVYEVKKTDASANAVTIARSGADLIDGAASVALSSRYQTSTVQAYAAGNAWVAKIGSAGANVTFGDGTALLPSMTFTGDLDTGIWHPGADAVGLSTNGTERLRVYADGGVQIGGTYGTSPATAQVIAPFAVSVEHGISGNRAVIGSEFFGYDAGNATLTGQFNQGFGNGALAKVTTGNRNNAFGRFVLNELTTGVRNTGVGHGAMQNVNGDYNVAIGGAAILGVTAGVTPLRNVAVGYSAMQDLTTGATDNVSIGYNSGRGISAGTSNTFLGSGAGTGGGQLINATNSMALGSGAVTTADNQVVIGNTSVTQTVLRGQITLPAATNFAITTVTGDTTLDATHRTVLVDATGGPITITLPAASAAAGREYRIKKLDASANAVTVASAGADSIEGAATEVLAGQYNAVSVQAHGSMWMKF